MTRQLVIEPDGAAPPGVSTAAGTDAADGSSGSLAAGRLLDLDPDIGEGIPSADWELARSATPVPVIQLPRGEWSLPQRAGERRDLHALVVVEGMLGREIALGGHYMLELLCHGDALLLPGASPYQRRLGGTNRLTALGRARIAVLSDSFLRAGARWPQLLSNLHRRIEAQRERLAIQGLAAHLPRAQDRLLLMLWLLADNCGHVTPEGTVLPLALTHEALGKLAAARRPTVTLALGALEERGWILRNPSGHLILTAAAEDEIDRITLTRETASPLTHSITLGALNAAAQPAA